jgi:hypothetical protein
MYGTMQTQPVAQPAARPPSPSSTEPAPELDTKGHDRDTAHDDDDLYANLAHTD